MSDTEVGKLLRHDEDAERDAIHIAMAPVIAHSDLNPGDRIGFIRRGDITAVGLVTDTFDGNTIGIVDPFLLKPVKEGERFWMFLYPRTITGLKHNWTHPAFEKAETAFFKTLTSASEQWIRNWAREQELDYDELMERAKDFQEYGEYWSEGGRFEGWSLPNDFWYHFKEVTDIEIKRDHGFFSCSC